MIDLDKMIENQAKMEGTPTEKVSGIDYKYVGTFINKAGAYKIEEGIGELLLNGRVAKYFTNNHGSETNDFINLLKLDTEGKLIDP